VIYDRAVQLARDSGVALQLKPVLPMVMRGVPVTVQKGRYIFFDAAREAEDLGIAPGRPRDPIGEPVRRLYAMLPWAMSCGRGVELLGEGLRAAFREGVDLAGERGLRQVVEAAGLSWAEACGHRRDTAWQALFEQNRQGLYGCGIWGVPAFRLLDAQGREMVSAWGQDRLWLVAREMAA
jgi:2-hydroxychromene-2-carboxylate isomerase